MKAYVKLVLIYFLVIMAAKARSQTAEFYQQKIDHYKTQQVIGVSLMASSLPVGTLGVYWIVHGSYLLDRESSDDDVWSDFFNGSFQLIGGVVCTAVGVGLLAGGTVITTIAGNKIDKYQEKLKGLKIGVICTPEQKGLALTYRF